MRLIIDTTGAVVKDSIVVCGVADAMYAARMASHIAKIAFEPARQDGHAVRSNVLIGYHF